MHKSENSAANNRWTKKVRVKNAGPVIFTVFAVVFSFIISVFSLASFAKNYSSDPLKTGGYESCPGDRITDIFVWKTTLEDVSDLQSLIDTTFCEEPLNGTDQNYILSIIQDPYIDADLSKYIDSLSKRLNEDIYSEIGIQPTTLQKSLITLKACLEYEKKKAGFEKSASYNAENTYGLENYVNHAVLETALDHTIGEKGIMSYIYGLTMLYSVSGEASYTVREALPDRKNVIDMLLTMQCADGGFTIAGDVGDVDVTAMTVQALAPEYCAGLIQTSDPEEASRLRSCVTNAISFLSEKQLQSGDYDSFGSACCESTAQTILALCSLRENPTYYDGPLSNTDFIKSGNTLLDGLMIYSGEDGGFSHTADTPSNDMASSQALCALTALMYDGKTDIPGQSVVPADQIKKADTASGEKSAFPLKIVIPAVILVSALAYGITLTLKRKKPIHLISALVVAVLAIGLFFGLDIRSRSSFENEKSNVLLSEKSAEALNISFTISAATVTDKVIYPENNLYIAPDSSVFDVLSEVCRTENIQLDYESSSVYGLAYIKGIDSIYEYDHGELSGWMYRVNGEMPNIGVGYYKVKEGDKVEILYSTNIGRDLDD